MQGHCLCEIQMVFDCHWMTLLDCGTLHSGLGSCLAWSWSKCGIILLLKLNHNSQKRWLQWVADL